MNTKEFHIQTGFLRRELIDLKKQTEIDPLWSTRLTEHDLFIYQAKDFSYLLKYFSTLQECFNEVRQSYQILPDFLPTIVYRDTDLLNTMLSNGVPIFLSHIDCFKRDGFTFLHVGLNNYLVQNDNYFFVWNTLNHLVLMESGCLIQVRPHELPMAWESRFYGTLFRNRQNSKDEE